MKRWLSLANELAKLNAEVHVLTLEPKSAEYSSIDEKLLTKIDGRIKVHRVSAWNPFKLIKKFFRRHIPPQGFSAPETSMKDVNLLTRLRSNLFIPDPRRTWNSKAVKKALEIISSEGIKTIVTTSPPHSTQLIGLKIVQSIDVKWIADFRDPWTDIFYYGRLGHSKISSWIDRRCESRVLSRADAILTVTWGFQDLLHRKVPHRERSCFHVIPNGIDGALAKANPAEFKRHVRVVYTGMLGDTYGVESFLEAVEFQNNKMQNEVISCEFYGTVSNDLRKSLNERFSFVHFKGIKPMEQMPQIQESADALFLSGPVGYESIIPGKLFEYIRASRPILYLGNPNSDVMRVLNETQSGSLLDRSKPEAYAQILQQLLANLRTGNGFLPNAAAISKYYRSNQAKSILDIVFDLEK